MKFLMRLKFFLLVLFVTIVALLAENRSNNEFLASRKLPAGKEKKNVANTAVDETAPIEKPSDLLKPTEGSSDKLPEIINREEEKMKAKRSRNVFVDRDPFSAYLQSGLQVLSAENENSSSRRITAAPSVRLDSSRLFRQYLLTVSMNFDYTTIQLWSVLVKLRPSSPPDILWKTIEKDPTIRFAPRPSFLEMMRKIDCNDLSGCSHLLHNSIDVSKLLRGILLRGPDNTQYPSESVSEDYVPILPEVPVMFRVIGGLRYLSLRDATWASLVLVLLINRRPYSSTLIPFTTPDWTRPVNGQEKGIYTFLSTNFLRNSFHGLALVEEERQRISRCMTYLPNASPFEPQNKTFFNLNLDKSSLCQRCNRRHDRTASDLNQQKPSVERLTRRHNHQESSQITSEDLSAEKTKKKDENRFSESPKVNGSTCKNSALPGSTKPLKQLSQTLNVSGIIRVEYAAMQIVFPVDDNPPDSPIETVQLSNTYLPSDIFPQLEVLATSYMNLGTDRALGLLMKQLCEQPKMNHNGWKDVCHFPCLPRGWKSSCVPGLPTLDTSSNITNIAIEGNFLAPTAAYCDASNIGLFQSASAEVDCQEAGKEEAGFSLSKPYEERIKINNCDEVHGTGKFEECSAIITELLLQKQLPANQESSSFGGATVAEIGNFLSLTTPTYMVGEAVTQPIYEFKRLGLMPKESDQPSADFHYLGDATSRFCSMPLRHTVTESALPGTVSLEEHNYCFRALNVTRNGPSIYFKQDLRNSKNDTIGDFGWELGSLLQIVLKPTFIIDTYYLKSSHWSGLMRE